MGLHPITKAEVLPVESLSFQRKPAVAELAGKHLLEIYEEYAEDKILTDGDVRSARKTIVSFRATIAQFAELFGDLPVRSITRACRPMHGTHARGDQGGASPMLTHRCALIEIQCALIVFPSQQKKRMYCQPAAEA